MFSGFANNCPHCGQWHQNQQVCPRIAAIEYYENGTIKRVEYWDDAPPPPPRQEPDNPFDFGITTVYIK